MQKAVTANQMKRLDELAITRYGIPSIILMENAGRALSKEVIKRIALLRRSRKGLVITIFCGKGNNGGDGIVCARYLFYEGVDTKVYLIGKKSSLRGDPAINLEILEGLGVKVLEIKNSKDLKELMNNFKARIIIDSIFGIGFKGKTEGIYENVIEFINNNEAYTFSVDIPSGLDATTGEAKGSCVVADETVTMGIAKTGMYKSDGRRYCGRIKVVKIGTATIF